MCLAVIAAGGTAHADKPEKPPAGMAKFVFFVKHARPAPPGQAKKPVVEPDVAKLGGKVLHAKDDYRVVYLPLAAAKHLRGDENVEYLQRIWMGESAEEWQATESMAPPSSASSPRRLQPTSDGDGPVWGPKVYSYDGTGNIKQIAEYNGGTLQANGSEQYWYDPVSRLTQAKVNDVTETYTYDGFGNLRKKQLAGQAAYEPAIDSASNRIANQTYDLAGNVTQTATKTMWYDSLGMMCAVSESGVENARRMYYTADDERIGMSLTSNVGRWTIRDFDGRVLREFRSDNESNMPIADWMWTEDYVYGAGQLLGGETPGPYSAQFDDERWRRHYHVDHLGTVRLATTDHSEALSVHSYYPFGTEQTPVNQEEASYGGVSAIRPEPMAFTGHQRDFFGSWNADNSNYLDYMHARYYDPNGGRFLSPDPALDLKKTMANPQMWNRYAYVMNNPVRYVDPDGRLVRLEGTKEDQQKLLDLIRQNLAQKDRNLVTLRKNGMLQIAAKAQGSTIAFTMLKNAVRDKNATVGVAFAQTALVKPGPGPVRPMQVDLQSTGGGLTTKAQYTMSGDIEVRIDPRVNPQGQPMSIVMGHELLGHGWDLMFVGTSSEHSATLTENYIRRDLGWPLRHPVPNDPER